MPPAPTTRLPAKLVVLISGTGSNLQAILDNIASGALAARVVAVISDRADAAGLEKAARAGMPGIVVARQFYARAADFHRVLGQRVASFAPDLVVLAGFMRILPAAFIARFAGKVMNIHPSLLPAYKGLNTHQRVLDAGEHHHGATVHWVTAQLDAGPIIAQELVHITPSDTAETLCERVLAVEHRIYTAAIRAFMHNAPATERQPTRRAQPAPLVAQHGG